MRQHSSVFGKTARPTVVGIGLTLVGAVMLAVAGHWAISERQLQRHGLGAAGTVVAIERSESSYFPIFSFQDARGRHLEVRSKISSDRYAPGDSVPVIYDPSRPLRARIDDPGMAFVGPAVIGAMGVLFLSVGVMVWAFRRRFDGDGRLIFGQKEPRHSMTSQKRREPARR